jgi:hypothetical protein
MKLYLDPYHGFTEAQTEYFESKGIKVGEIFEVPSIEFLESLILKLNGALVLSRLTYAGEQHEPSLDPNLISINHPHDY